MASITVNEKAHTAGQSVKTGRTKQVAISDITANDKVWVKHTPNSSYLMQRGQVAPLCKLTDGATVDVWQPIFSAI